jgi:thioredoxin reductase
MIDAIVVGGSYAGLAAALQLARARRSVLILDSGERRNRFVSAAHGFIGFDGVDPSDIQARAREDVLAYSTVAWRDAAVTEISGQQGDFRVRANGEEHHAKRLVLATGVRDELPAIPGLAERWGKSVFVCPYCDGYELELGAIGVIASSPNSIHQAQLVTEWAAPGGVTFFAGDFEPDETQAAELATRRITVVRGAVTQVTGDTTHHASAVVHVGDAAHPVRGVFVMPRTHVVGPFAAQLGCELEEGPLGMFYKTTPLKETTVPGVFAAGDVAQPMGSVSFAVADGARAGASVHQSLVFR